MASKTVVEWVDDLDGAPAEETVSFSLDGVEYEIDLSAAHATKLRAALKEFIRRARPEGNRARRTVEPVDETPAVVPAPVVESVRSRPAPRSAIKSAHRISATQLTMDVDAIDEQPATPLAAANVPRKAPAKSAAARSASAKTTAPAKSAPAKAAPAQVEPAKAKPATRAQPAAAAPAPKQEQRKQEQRKQVAPKREAAKQVQAKPAESAQEPVQQEPNEAATEAAQKVASPFSQPALPGFTSTPPKEETTTPSRPPMITFTSAKP